MKKSQVWCHTLGVDQMLLVVGKAGVLGTHHCFQQEISQNQAFPKSAFLTVRAEVKKNCMQSNRNELIERRRELATALC